MIGNVTCRFHIPNDFGDGQHKIIVAKKDDDTTFFDYNSYDWRGCIEGDLIYVYNYDCLREEELGDNVLFSLKGCYDIYVKCGTIFLKER